jgi:hypothetical protein
MTERYPGSKNIGNRPLRELMPRGGRVNGIGGKWDENGRKDEWEPSKMSGEWMAMGASECG